MKTLAIGILCIDRDYDLLDELFQSIVESCKYADVIPIFIVTCRSTDVNCVKFWKSKELIEFKCHINIMPEYSITGRHNYEKIAECRNIIINKCIELKNDLLFIDSDIIINTNTIKLLINSHTDVTGSLYIIPWSGKFSIGIIKRGNFYLKHVSDIDDILYYNCNIIGFGCTLIKEKSLFECVIGNIRVGRQSYVGEDIGFFIECYEKNISVSYISSVTHKYNRSIHHVGDQFP